MTAVETGAAPARSALVAVDKLDFHPRNVRTDLGDLRELAASISEVGILEPLLVEDRGVRGRVLAGHRRLAAARQAGLRRVPAVIVDQHADEDAIVVMVSGNRHRLGLTPADKTAAARALRDEFGWTQSRIAQRFGVHQQTVGRWLAGAAVDDRTRRAAPAPAYRPRSSPPRVPKVGARAVHDLADRWEHRAPRELIEELRGLLGGWSP